MSHSQNHPYILIVDDDPDCRDLMAFALQEIGSYSILVATQGADAMRVMKLNGTPALVITDMTMPIMSGSKLIKEMRGSDLLKQVPVVILSGDDFLKKEDMEMTAVQLKKPCAKEELIRVVVSCLKEF